MNTDSRGYPRPQLVRPHWQPLNGRWDFSIDAGGALRSPGAVQWNEKIEVPFAPETERSGVGRMDFFQACWYRRKFQLQPPGRGRRALLHFGAVDYVATVWINGHYAGAHTGGYTPFHCDITDFLIEGAEQEVVVRAEDDPFDLEKPRGKQDWLLNPHSIWYPRTTGIWQTVWLEVVPETRVGRISWTPNLVRWELGFECWIDGPLRSDLRVKLTLNSNGRVLVEDEYAVQSNEVHRRIALSDPGIDDSRNALLWSPENPQLIEGKVQLKSASGELIEEVQTYTALRSVALEGDRFILNGRPYKLRLVLDQGYWPDTGLTAPDDEAFVRDIQLTKAMGFNGVRKHQKVEDPRYLYWADHMGLLVWGEMPSAYRFTSLSVRRTTREWEDAVQRDFSHPCIVAWVPVNESWGVPNLPQNPVERHYVQALFHLTKTLDATRPVVGNDGWESVATDIIGIHDYDGSPERLRHRYHGDRLLPHLLRQERPGGRMLIVGEAEDKGHPVVLSEFGGIALSTQNGGSWGYSSCRDPEHLRQRYGELMDAIHSIGMFTGFCYTQFADTYQEANGLLYADRTPKIPLEEIRRATSGVRGERLAPR